jgi:hypothetical protein
MDKLIRLGTIELPLSLHKATVIHANKYSEAQGGAFSLPVSSTLYTDIVFRLDGTNEDLKAYVQGSDLPVYTQQEVTVFCTGKKVLGFIDSATNYYYYITRDFSRYLKYGLPYIWIWIIGLLGGTAIYVLTYEDNGSPWMMAPLIAAYLFYYVQKLVFNFRIRKAIDNFLQ